MSPQLGYSEGGEARSLQKVNAERNKLAHSGKESVRSRVLSSQGEELRVVAALCQRWFSRTERGPLVSLAHTSNLYLGEATIRHLAQHLNRVAEHHR